MNPAWHEWRRQGIGGSDAPVVKGVSPWKTRYQLFNEKAFGVSDQVDNPNMRYGRENEEAARADFEKRMGIMVAPGQVISAERSWLRANVDGISLDGSIFVELKNPNKDDHSVARNGRVPEKYYPQCQHTIKAAIEAGYNLKGMYYSSHYQGASAIVEVPRDDTYIASLMKDEQEFWDMVLQKTPPALTDRDYINMEENTEFEEIAKRLFFARNQCKDWEQKYEMEKARLIEITGSKSAKGRTTSLTKSVVQGSIDYREAIRDYVDNMKSHYPDVIFPEVPFESYRKEAYTKFTPSIIKR